MEVSWPVADVTISKNSIYLCRSPVKELPDREPMLELFGDKLRYLRQQWNVTQSELARQLDIKPPHANNLEAGRRAPSIELVLKIADLFSVRTDYLLQDSVRVEDVAQYQTDFVASRAMDSQSLGHKFRELRQRQGLTQGDVAQQLGLGSHSHISFVETGTKEPSLELVVQLVKLFGVTTDYVLRDDSSPSHS